MDRAERIARIRIDLAAEMVHEVNRAYCALVGDTSQLPWDQAPAWQRESAIAGVTAVRDGTVANPQAAHESWTAQKVADGWVYGDVKDAEKKTHPCLVPYDQLPPEQRVKDILFLAAARAALQVWSYDLPG